MSIPSPTQRHVSDDFHQSNSVGDDDVNQNTCLFKHRTICPTSINQNRFWCLKPTWMTRFPWSVYLSPVSPQTKETLLETTPTERRIIVQPSPNSCPPKPLLPLPLPPPPPSLNYSPMPTHIRGRLLRHPLRHPRSLITLLVISPPHFPFVFLPCL